MPMVRSTTSPEPSPPITCAGSTTTTPTSTRPPAGSSPADSTAANELLLVGKRGIQSLQTMTPPVPDLAGPIARGALETLTVDGVYGGAGPFVPGASVGVLRRGHPPGPGCRLPGAAGAGRDQRPGGRRRPAGRTGALGAASPTGTRAGPGLLRDVRLPGRPARGDAHRPHGRAPRGPRRNGEVSSFRPVRRGRPAGTRRQRGHLLPRPPGAGAPPRRRSASRWSWT